MNPHIGFVASDTFSCWAAIKDTIRAFFKEKSVIYYDEEDQQRIYNEFLERALAIVDNYSATDHSEKDLRNEVTSLIEDIFAKVKPVINLQMCTGEKLELTLSALTGIDPHEFVSLRNDIADICGTSAPVDDSTLTQPNRDDTEDELVNSQ